MEAHELAILQKWLYNTVPLIGGWFRRRTARVLAHALQRDGDAKVAALLAEAVTRTRDDKLRQLALDALRQIHAQACIDPVVAVWQETRHPALTKMLVEQAWVASAPIELRVMSALKAGPPELLGDGGAEVVAPLVAACEDRDPDISQRAQALLVQLRRAEAKEALCQLVLARDHPHARAAALTTGYLPKEAGARALFLFLTEQWERYEAFDFDHALLSTAHRAAPPELRRRIADKLRAAGRTDFLTVLAGADYRSQAADMTALETDVLVQMLTEHREWGKLWQLAFEIPLSHSSQIVKSLNRAGWQPARGDEQHLLAELGALAAADMATSEIEVRQTLPLALQEAAVRVNGRVNDVAFAPNRPVIAIGGGNRKVALWNFQQGAMEQVCGGFAHSIGLVAFLPDGTLLCAERTNALDAPCGIYLCRADGNIRLGEHLGSVTALEPVGETQLLSTGRDQQIRLWDVPERRQVQAETLTFWPRAAKVSPDGQHVALLHEHVTLRNLPRLDQSRTAWKKDGVSHCAAFVPGEQALIVGKANGHVLIYEYSEKSFAKEPQALMRHSRCVQGIAVLPNDRTMITAGAEGRLHFTNWQDRTSPGVITVPQGRFTSLHLSPDGAFLATGDSDASMSLWDVRVRELPNLFTRPFAQASPDHLAAVSELAANPKIAPNVRQSLTFIRKVLQYRFRFDIEIDEIPAIKVGEFDIEIG